MSFNSNVFTLTDLFGAGNHDYSIYTKEDWDTKKMNKCV